MPAQLDVRRPFTRAEAVAAGLTDRRLAGPRFQRVFTGIHLDASVPLTPRLRTEAALLLLAPDAFASHSSAARLHGLPVPRTAAEHLTVSRPGDRRRASGLRCHVAADVSDVVRVDGVRASSALRTFAELGSTLDLVDLVAAGDHLVRHGHTGHGGLRDYCLRSGIRGSRAAARAAAHVRAGVDSPMESRLRMLLTLAGLPEPEINVVVRDHDGTPLRRYDLSYPAARVAVEYDGRHHAESVRQWQRDLERREVMDDSGWRLVVVTARGLYSDPGDTVRRVHRLLRARRLPGVPAEPEQRWRAHFGTAY